MPFEPGPFSFFLFPFPWVTAAVAEFGRYGIDLFFVISGFVIYYTNYPRAQPAAAFLLRRALRIVPQY